MIFALASQFHFDVPYLGHSVLIMKVLVGTFNKQKAWNFETLVQTRIGHSQ